MRHDRHRTKKAGNFSPPFLLSRQTKQESEMKYLAAIALMLIIISTPAVSGACDGDDEKIATLELQLGNILASETTCNLNMMRMQSKILF
jgi:hypothetical protein